MLNSDHVSEHDQQRMDDLTQIHGIGPSMEHRLNQAGVFTFDRLAKMSSNELASVFGHTPGWSRERIAEMRIIDQARDLMKKEATAGNLSLNNHSQYTALFSLDLLLDTQRHVRRTHIVYAPTGKDKEEDGWPDWDEKRLAKFIFEHAKISSDRASTEASDKQPALKSSVKEQQAPVKQIMDDLSISEVEIRSSAGEPTHWLVTRDSPFAINLALDLSKTTISPGTPLRSQTEIYAKSLSNGKRYKIGEKESVIESRNLLRLIVDCQALSPGTYRLEACIFLSPEMENSEPMSSFIAINEGRIFQVN